MPSPSRFLRSAFPKPASGARKVREIHQIGVGSPPAKLGELTVHIPHLSVKKPSLVTFRDLYLRPPVQKAGAAPLAKAKDQRRQSLGAPWAGSRACAEPSMAEFADLKRGWLRQPFRSGPATPAAGRNRRLRHAWRGTEGIRWPWPRAQSADRTGRISWR